MWYAKMKNRKQKSKRKRESTRAMTSASTTGMWLYLNMEETVLFPDAIPPVSPTILIFTQPFPFSASVL